MSGENKSRALWNFVNLVHENGSTLFKTSNHVLVVNNFLANIDWGSIVI
jgi:hypothetical protein